jgi:nucleotide-binding universal stress UspA family protein
MTPHRPLGNVLVATDFSPAAVRAARLPMAPGSTVTVLHVLPSGAGGADRAAAERSLERVAADLREMAAAVGTRDVTVFPRLVEGATALEIVRAAHHGRNELIVVGRHGKSTFRDAVLGSTAEQLIRRGGTAVLVVAAPPAGPYARPLAAVDFADTSRRAAELAWRLAAPDVAALGVIHAYTPIPDGTLRRASIFGEAAIEYRLAARRQAEYAVREFLAGDGAVPVAVTAREGDAVEEIRRAASHCDVLAVGTHGRSGAAHVLLGSVAEAVIRAATCDVLVAPSLGRPIHV